MAMHHSHNKSFLYQQGLKGPAETTARLVWPADVKDGNAQEAMLAGPASCSPGVRFGCKVDHVFQATVSFAAVMMITIMIITMMVIAVI